MTFRRGSSYLLLATLRSLKPMVRQSEFTTVVSVLWLGPEWVGRWGRRGLAKSVERFSLRDLPGSFGFPIFRNRVPMGVGRSGLDREMQDFKGFHFVYSKTFFRQRFGVPKPSWALANRQPPEPPEPHFRIRARTGTFQLHFSGRRATQGRYRRSGLVGRLGDSVR